MYSVFPVTSLERAQLVWDYKALKEEMPVWLSVSDNILLFVTLVVFSYSILKTFSCYHVNTGSICALNSTGTHLPLGMNYVYVYCTSHFIYKWDYGTTSDPYNLHHTPHPSMTPQPSLDITMTVYGFLLGAVHRHHPTHALHVAPTHTHTLTPPWPEYQAHTHIHTSLLNVVVTFVHQFHVCYRSLLNPVWTLSLTTSYLFHDMYAGRLCVDVQYTVSVPKHLIPVAPRHPPSSYHRYTQCVTDLWCSGVEVRA